jgi:hypothetical protein
MFSKKDRTPREKKSAKKIAPRAKTISVKKIPPRAKKIQLKKSHPAQKKIQHTKSNSVKKIQPKKSHPAKKNSEKKFRKNPTLLQKQKKTLIFGQLILIPKNLPK